jgi:hypothetical protein
MKHPVRSDFHTVITEADVSVTFKPTDSTYSFVRLADADVSTRTGPPFFVGVQHGGHNTEDYAPDEIKTIAQQLALEHARAVWSVQETTEDRAPLGPASFARVPYRIASEVAATVRLIQSLNKAE